MQHRDTPSDWIQRWAHLVPAGAPVLDVACGLGRHLRWFAACGHPVTGVDRSPQAIEAAAAVGEALCADIENAPWPLPGRACTGLRVVAYEDGYLDTPERFVQRIAAVRPLADADAPARHLLRAASS